MARQLFLAVLLCLGLVLPVSAIDVEVGQWIEVKATTSQGVPVHRNPEPSLVERLRDGTRAKVAELADDGHWLRLNYGTGKTGWIIDRYVGRVVSETPPAGGRDQVEQAVWTSQQACMQQVTADRRAAPTSPDKLRVGSWNIRWFPDETNVPWLACTIAWMNVDVLALIEIRDTQDAKDAMARVLLLLESLTQSPWAVDLHQCGPANMQHVGFLWNTSRATLSDQSDMWAFNARGTATGSACAGSLRPGRYAYVKGAGNGVDFHAISAHLKSGSTGAARAERLAVFERLSSAVADLLQTDGDVVVLGDLNTMGDGSSGSAGAELNDLLTVASSKGYARLGLAPACTEYYQGRPNWLDHVLVKRSMSEVDQAVSARVTGYCALKRCANIGTEKPAAYSQLSDHCPLMFEIANRDAD